LSGVVKKLAHDTHVIVKHSPTSYFSQMGVIITIEFVGEEPERNNLKHPDEVYNAIIWLAEHCDWKKDESSAELRYVVERFPKILDPRLKEQPINPPNQ